VKLLHTADWHVGKGIAGRSRADEHRAVLAETVTLARREEVDLILVAGDLFDSASPSPEAEHIVYRTLLSLSDVAPVVAIPGNHDNERRLEAIASVFELVHVVVRPLPDPESVRLETSAGEQVCVATLPWISHRYAVKADQLMAKDASELTGDFRDRMGRIIEKVTEPFSGDAVNLLVGHVTIAGGQMGGGERTAQTIFDYWIDATAFPAHAHYVALGHLHKAQKMQGACPIHYCGSPLMLDFSDTGDSRGALVVEASPGTPAIVREHPLSSGRRLRTLKGTLEQLAALRDEVGDDYLRVRVEARARTGLGDEVRELFPNAVKVIVESDGEDTKRATGRLERATTSPGELFTEYLAEREVEDAKLVDLFQKLYEEASA
jgi:DNA repair protein SbcD/Mre11